MNKIKVCHIITMLELGGAQRNTLYTVSHLDRNMFEPVLVSGPGGMLDDEAKSLEGVKTYFVRDLVRPVNPLKDFLALIELFSILRKEKPDIVHTHSSKAGVLGRLAARLAGIKLIIHTYHGFGFNDFQSTVTRCVFVLAEKLVAPITTRFIVVTKEDVSKGIAHGLGHEDKYTIIRSGIDVSKYALGVRDAGSVKKEFVVSESDQIVTTIGPFKPQKNIADFIKVCAAVSKELPGTRFLVVGDGEQRRLIESLISKFSLDKAVSLLGWRADTDRILSVTDVFVMTSLWEGLPRAILEAMSSSVPVVANAVDGVKEIVRDRETGYLIEPGDVESAAQRTLFLLKDPETSKTMGKRAKALIGLEFDINHMVSRQEELYLGLTEK